MIYFLQESRTSSTAERSVCGTCFEPPQREGGETCPPKPPSRGGRNRKSGVEERRE
jgi:hypothetical protein